MSIQTQTLLALVSRHLVSLMLFSVWHILNSLLFNLTLHGTHKALCGLECGDIVCRNGHSGHLGDVACSLLGAVLDDEAAESAKIHRLTLDKRPLDALHCGLNYSLNCNFLNSGCFCNLIYDFCFGLCFYYFKSV